MIYKDEKRGTYFVKVTWKDAVTGKYKEHRKRGFSTKREAKEYEANYLLNAPSSTEYTFRNVHELYLKSIDATEANKTKQINYLVKYFPYYEAQIDRITRSDMLKYRESLQNEQLATRTKNRGILYVKSVCAFANKIYSIPDNSVILNNFKLTKEDKAEPETWTIDDFNKFASCVDNSEYRLFFEFLFYTGCRRGEALALQYTDIEGDTVNITKSIKHYKNGFLNLKTDGSKRKIKLDRELLEHLQPNIEDASKEKPFIFGGYTSLSISQVQRYFTAGIKASGVPVIRLHDLRHSHATLLINSGCNIVAVSKRLGHSSIEQTLKTYTHLLKDSETELINKLEALKSEN